MLQHIHSAYARLSDRLALTRTHDVDRGELPTWVVISGVILVAVVAIVSLLFGPNVDYPT